uniref:Ubiquitin-like domain-containing protein n=1 Tax=Nicotiana tabacum TaxID=4097 RepID=A0A1S4B458_TOBAC|nr:PREDICTED: uncharacterized protein LOC107804278 [Nicotiana tabacum]
MVEPNESIAAVKAYIQEEKGIPFKKQKLLNEDGRVLRYSQTLLSAEIENGSTLILRYAPITQIFSLALFTRPKLKIMVKADDTIADVKAAIKEKEGLQFCKQKLIFHGRHLEDDKSLVHYEIQYGSVLHCASKMKVELKGCLNDESALENTEKEKPGKSQLDQALAWRGQLKSRPNQALRCYRCMPRNSSRIGELFEALSDPEKVFKALNRANKKGKPQQNSSEKIESDMEDDHLNNINNENDPNNQGVVPLGPEAALYDWAQPTVDNLATAIVVP